MKKFYIFLLVMAVLTAASSASAAEIVYKSLGTGYMTDDMITQLLDRQPVTYPVEIQQADDDSPFYRVIAPYGKAFADAMAAVNNLALTDDQFDSEGKCFIDIDASDPDNVIFHKTMTGFDIGAGEIFIGINTLYNVTLKDGVFTAPIMGIAVGAGNSAIAANRRGKFRIVLPGVALSDFEISLKPVSQCLTERTFKASLTVGEGIKTVRYHIIPDMQEDEMLSAVKQIAAGGAVFSKRGDFTVDMSQANKETIIVVALDPADNIVGYDWCTYYFIDDTSEGWIDRGNAEFTDGFLQSLIANIPSQTTTTKLQQSADRPGYYRLVNPYAGLKEYAALNKGHESHNHYIYINAEDPDLIYIEESPIGMESAQYGLMRVSSSVAYFLGAGFDADECKELELGAIVEDGVMTFPEESLMFSMMKYENADWHMTDPDGVTKIKLPAGFSFVSGVEDITIDETCTPVYYNIQGLRVDNPEAGSVYIRVSGDKAEKVLVR